MVTSSRREAVAKVGEKRRRREVEARRRRRSADGERKRRSSEEEEEVEVDNREARRPLLPLLLRRAMVSNFLCVFLKRRRDLP